jgi:hypothetical protein
MKAYQDRVTGKWKWGKNGSAIYDTRELAERSGMESLTKRLREIRSKVDSISTNGFRV